jgi:hypothetical protein
MPEAMGSGVWSTVSNMAYVAGDPKIPPATSSPKHKLNPTTTHRIVITPIEMYD